MYPAGYSVFIVRVTGAAIVVKTYCVQTKHFNSLFIDSGVVEEYDVMRATATVRR